MASAWWRPSGELHQTGVAFMAERRLLIIAHAPSPNTLHLRGAAARGARHPDVNGVSTMVLSPFDARAEHVLKTDAILLGTTENLGYMSGALKDFFDRIYYPCLEETRGRPYAFYVRAGHDGTGTRRGIESIATGLGWRSVVEPLICRGPWDPAFVPAVEELALTVAAGLEAGIF